MATSRKQKKKNDQRNRPLNANGQADVQMAVANPLGPGAPLPVDGLDPAYGRVRV
jgi:hypothetical protein